ncbi:hypothetical protein, partial [Amycolatopsis sp. WAC 04169]|uniref:hypothetical protein n=1 Tax=Amycolatopsis sp. WAC 04169 TaxID=2203197 RepID=UPI0018F660FA
MILFALVPFSGLPVLGGVRALRGAGGRGAARGRVRHEAGYAGYEARPRGAAEAAHDGRRGRDRPGNPASRVRGAGRRRPDIGGRVPASALHARRRPGADAVARVTGRLGQQPYETQGAGRQREAADDQQHLAGAGPAVPAAAAPRVPRPRPHVGGRARGRTAGR